MTVRLGVIPVLALTLSACDTMIADRFVIRAPVTHPSPAASAGDILATTRVAFGDCGLAEADVTDFGDSLHWRSPKKPPGLHVMVHSAAEGLQVTLAQDLFGPIGPTDAYRCVKKSLRRRLEDRYGKEGVRMRS
jgi:hypothetical protein